MAPHSRAVFAMVVNMWLVLIVVTVFVVVDALPLTKKMMHPHQRRASAAERHQHAQEQRAGGVHVIQNGMPTMASIAAEAAASIKGDGGDDDHFEAYSMEGLSQQQAKKAKQHHGRRRPQQHRKIQHGPFDNGFGLTPQEVIDYKRKEPTVARKGNYATTRGHSQSTTALDELERHATDPAREELERHEREREREERRREREDGEDDESTGNADVDEYEKEITIYQLQTPHLVVQELREQQAMHLNFSDPLIAMEAHKHPPLPEPSEDEMKCLMGYTKLFAEGSFGIHDGNAPPRPAECPLPTRKGAIGLLVHTDDYLQGALTVAHALTAGGMLDMERFDVLMMFTDLIPEASLVPFKLLGCVVRRIEKITNPHDHFFSRWKWNFSQIDLWQQLDYEKIVYIDSDVLVVKPLNEMFNLHEPSAAMNYVSTAGPEGYFDKGRLFNGGMMVLEPSLLTYYQLLGYLHNWVDNPDHNLRNSAGNQPFFNAFFKSRNPEVFERDSWKWWYTPLNYAYNLNAMTAVQRPGAIRPNAKRDITRTNPEELLRDARVIHFTRVKPWKVAGTKAISKVVSGLVKERHDVTQTDVTYMRAVLLYEINLYVEQMVGVASTLKKYCDSGDIDLKLEGYTEPYDGSTLDVTCSCYDEMNAIAVCMQHGGDLSDAMCVEVKSNRDQLWRKGFFGSEPSSAVVSHASVPVRNPRYRGRRHRESKGQYRTFLILAGFFMFVIAMGCGVVFCLTRDSVMNPTKQKFVYE